MLWIVTAKIVIVRLHVNVIVVIAKKYSNLS